MHKDQLQLLTDYWQLVRMTKARRFTQSKLFVYIEDSSSICNGPRSKPCTRVVVLVIDE
jgi:murein endopeptidase